MKKTNITTLKKSLGFLEELSWLLESRKNLNLKETVVILNELINNNIVSNNIQNIAPKHTSPNPNINYLIGVLPRLFQDKELFPTNSSLADFSSEVLGIKVSRYDKRSKYELIGFIICETDKLSDKKLSNLVKALSELTSNEKKLKQIRNKKNENNFSWNEAIQELTGLND